MFALVHIQLMKAAKPIARKNWIPLYWYLWTMGPHNKNILCYGELSLHKNKHTGNQGAAITQQHGQMIPNKIEALLSWRESYIAFVFDVLYSVLCSVGWFITFIRWLLRVKFEIVNPNAETRIRRQMATVWFLWHVSIMNSKDTFQETLSLPLPYELGTSNVQSINSFKLWICNIVGILVILFTLPNFTWNDLKAEVISVKWIDICHVQCLPKTGNSFIKYHC